MTCPLTALASIAALTAEVESALSSSPISIHSKSSSNGPVSEKQQPPSKEKVKKRRRRSPQKKRRGGVTSSASSDKPTKKAKCSNESAPSKNDHRAELRSASSSSSTSTPSSAPASPPNDDNNTNNAKANFPAVLMSIMSTPQSSEYISFLSDEQRFIIINPGALEQEVLPMYCLGDKEWSYNDLLGKLKVWGFNISTEPQYPQVKVYHHPMFRKGDWESCLQMTLPNTSSPLEVQHEDTLPNRRARSVTPQDIGTNPAVGGNPSIAQSSVNLEQLVRASSETRRRLSFGSMDGEMSLHEMSSLCAHGGQSSLSAKVILGLELGSYSMSSLGKAHTSSMMSRRNLDKLLPRPSNLSLEGHQQQQNHFLSGQLTDSQVSWLTSSVVSAAMRALRCSGDYHYPELSKVYEQPKLASYVSLSSSSSSSLSSLDSSNDLDAMNVRAFIEQSNARRSRSRPVGILGAIH